jgi:hypothetical protein
MSKSKAARRARKTRRPPRRRTGRAGAAAQNRNPQFEAIALTVDAGPRDELARVVDRVAKGARLAGWQGELVSVAEGQFELVPPPGGESD